MNRENLKVANKINEELTELEDFNNDIGGLVIAVKTSNGGEGDYLKPIPDRLKLQATDLIRKLISSEIRRLTEDLKDI